MYGVVSPFSRPLHCSPLIQAFPLRSCTPAIPGTSRHILLLPGQAQAPCGKAIPYIHSASSVSTSLSTISLTISTYTFFTDSCFGIVTSLQPPCHHYKWCHIWRQPKFIKEMKIIHTFHYIERPPDRSLPDGFHRLK